MLKKQIVLLILLIFVLPAITYATINQALDDFMNTMNEGTSYTDSGMYKGRKGTYFQGAGMTFKSRVQGPPTFGVTMPTLDAGCNGISFNMGAISIPSEAEFVNFVKTVGQNATGYAFKLALSTLAPQVASLLNDIQNFVGKINNMIKNSCNTAQALLEGRNPLETEGVVTAAKQIANCKRYSATTGTFDTDGAKADIRCSNPVDRFKAWIAGSPEEAAAKGYYNYTWQVLKKMNYSNTSLETLGGLIGMDYQNGFEVPGHIEVNLEMIICGKDKGCGIEIPSSSSVSISGFPNCNSDYGKCLSPQSQSIPWQPLGYQIYNYYNTIYNNVISKTATPLPAISIPLTSVGQDVRFKVFLMGKLRSKFTLIDAQNYISLYSNLIAAKAVQSTIHKYSLEPINIGNIMDEETEKKVKESINNRLKAIDEIVTEIGIEINNKDNTEDIKTATLQRAMYKNIAQGRVGFAIMKMRK